MVGYEGEGFDEADECETHSLGTSRDVYYTVGLARSLGWTSTACREMSV